MIIGAGGDDAVVTETAESTLPVAENITFHPSKLSREERWAALETNGATIWMTGLSGSGKSTIATAIEHTLVSAGQSSFMLDGDNLRHGLNANLGFSEEDRNENVRRVGEVARILAEAGSVAIVSLVSPYRAERDRVRAIHEEAGIPFYEVFVDTPLEECERRDPKGLYAKARAGEIKDLTGVGAPYEAPESPSCAPRPTSKRPSARSSPCSAERVRSYRRIATITANSGLRRYLRLAEAVGVVGAELGEGLVGRAVVVGGGGRDEARARRRGRAGGSVCSSVWVG